MLFCIYTLLLHSSLRLFFSSHFVTVGIPIVTNLTQFVTFLCIHSVPCYLYLSYAYFDSYFLVFRVFGNLGKED